MKVFMHITYLEEKGRLADAFALAHELGFGGIELRGFDNFKEMSDNEYIDAVKDIFKNYPDLKVTFNMHGQFTDSDAAVRQKWETRICEQLKRIRENINIDFVNIATGFIKDPERKGGPGVQGSNAAQQWHWDAVTEHIRNIGEAAAGLDMRIALETHHGLIHDTAPATRKLIDMISMENVGVTFDYGNMILHPETLNLEESLEMLKDKIFYVHLKNALKCDNTWVRTMMELGSIDHHKYLSIISKWDHLKNIALEYPAAGDRIYACEKDIAYLRNKAGRFKMELD